jgi:predicted metal-binding membrane protein
MHGFPFRTGVGYAKPMTQAADPLAHLSAVETRLHHALLRPRALAVACLAVLAGSGWLYLGLMLGARGGGGDGALLAALCRPTFGQSVFGSWDLVPVVLMWAAMTFAMMLPTAGPMVVTYAEIAETAAAKGERVVSPLVLTAGYLTVWLGFSVLATLLQGLLTRFALLHPELAAASGVFSGAVFVAAGAYQFSPLKHACLTLCQRPFPFFFANWSTAPRAVFRLGLRQGLYCLGCCWAMMLVMFAVGAMNVVWMAVLGVVMGVEKTMSTTRFSRAVGTVFLLGGILFVISASVQE